MAFRGRVARVQLHQLKKCILSVANCLVEEVENMLNEEQDSIKRIWCRKWISRRNTRGASALLLRELSAEDPEEYRLCLRLTTEQFEYLLAMISPTVQRSDTLLRDALPARTKLEVTLNFLATGNSYRTLQQMFRVSKSAISNCIPEVCDAISDALKGFIKIPATKEEWEKIAHGFRDRWNFPMCCGSIDGKHILIQAPPNCGTEYYNYKGQNSIVLMAVADYNYCFQYIDIGCNGIVSDGGVFQNSTLYTALENGMLPEGYCFVGDDAFPLKIYLTKPYNATPLTKEEKIFNYRLSRARRIIENAFGILVSRFRIFEKKIPCSLLTVDKIVKCCCTMHNWLRKTSPNTYSPQGSMDEEYVDNGEIIPGKWRAEVREMRSLTRRDSGYRSSRLAREFRDHMKRYFNNEGSVPWQDYKIY